MTDTVTAKIAEWEALVPTEKWTLVGSTILSAEEGYVGQVSGLGWHDKGEFIAAAPAIATALLGFVKDVLTLIDEDHCPGGCEHDAIDAEVLGDRIKRALMEQIGGEG